MTKNVEIYLFFIMLSRGIIYCLKKTCSTRDFPRLLVCGVGVYLKQNDIGFIIVAICCVFSPYIA